MKLKKELGFIDLFSIASGAMISSGLFVLPGLAYAKIGPAVFVAYVIAGLLIIPSMLSQAELATAMPKAGGAYFFIDRSMGAGLGTLAGLSNWFAISFKSAFALLGIGAFTSLIYPSVTYTHIQMVAATLCIIFAFINLVGVKHAGRFQVFLVIALLLLLSIYVTRGLPSVTLDNFRPFMTGNSRTLFATAGLIFISYGGLTKIASVSEEVRDPSKNIPLSMIASFTVVTLLYVLSVFVTAGVLGTSLIKASGEPSLTPISDGAGIFLGNWGKIALSIAAILAFVSTANAGILSASRAPLAMSRDKLLPSFFGSIHEKFKTPHNSILFTAIFMVLVILFLDLEMLVKTASTIMILLFGAVNIAVIIMRESGVQNYQPKFKAPFYPWIQIAAVIIYAFLLFEMGGMPILISAIFLGMGLLWYWVYGRIHSNRESALLHLVQRITAKELDTYALNTELKEILRDRDEIVEDRFDVLIKNAIVVELDGCKTLEETFRIIAEFLAKEVDMDSDDVYELLMKRERESSTAISPGLAIPHIILPGENKFEMVIARCKEGIIFAPDTEPVHAVFVLAGSSDERNFHLKALMYIAQIVQKRDFLDEWLKARSKEGLRDVLLLSERKRE